MLLKQRNEITKTTNVLDNDNQCIVKTITLDNSTQLPNEFNKYFTSTEYNKAYTTVVCFVRNKWKHPVPRASQTILLTKQIKITNNK